MLEKNMTLATMETTRARAAAPISSYLEASSACANRLDNLASECEDLGEERPLKETLLRAQQVEPLTAQLKDTRQE